MDNYVQKVLLLRWNEAGGGQGQRKTTPLGARLRRHCKMRRTKGVATDAEAEGRFSVATGRPAVAGHCSCHLENVVKKAQSTDGVRKRDETKVGPPTKEPSIRRARYKILHQAIVKFVK